MEIITEITVLSILILIIKDYWADGKAQVCLNCGAKDFSKKLGKGSLLIELFFWGIGIFVFVVLPVAFIYSLWRRLRTPKRCGTCGQTGIIPLDSAIAKNKLSRENANGKPLTGQGNAVFQSFLGWMRQFGLRASLDDNKAARRYRLLAEQGEAKAQLFLGWMHSKGQGVPQNYKEAAKWYRLSAEQGEPIAQYNLGVIYTRKKGSFRDFRQAHKWFNIAGTNGHELGHQNRSLIEKVMTPNQIAQSRRLAQKWMEKHEKKQKQPNVVL